ncbi:MAG: UDP-glucose/GDP-mannose dehydrogenase family protein [Candidatus Andersenbacteria bacterium]|nr:UDP-glucose/GDP-mannose dehydrogenase family protein [Candidatus Andersenbacteria bacterium]
MKISIFGTGYVGLVTGACFAELGNNVVCYDIDEKKIEKLKEGRIPFFEPELGNLVNKNIKKERISFTLSPEEAVLSKKAIFIAVGTPQKKSGEADLSYVKKAAKEIGKNLKEHAIIINKSTVPVGTGDLVRNIIKKEYNGSFDIASNPEFLREGSAVFDFMNPERIIIGTDFTESKKIIKDLYEPFSCPVVNTKIETAEMIKYASNAFLAAKISFINEIANVCERVGANVDEVAYAMGLDSRIGNKFLDAGIGYGGSCFPKDVRALHNIALNNNYKFKLLKAVVRVNNDQKLLLAEKTERLLGDLKNKKICVWGISFKPNTDDTRESAAIDIINLLEKKGGKINAYDPKVDYKKLRRDNKFKAVNFYSNKYDALKNCQVLIIATEWNEFKNANLKRIKSLLQKPNIIDGRNIYDLNKMKKSGFNYLSVGRV